MATQEEKLEALKDIDMSKVQSVSTLREIWKRAYGTVGHKVLGRMLLGETAEKALRLE